MTNTLSTVASLSDDELLAHVGKLATRERQATAELVASLCELDARRLYLGAGCSSLFAYCTEVLHLSEHAAYGRRQLALRAVLHDGREIGVDLGGERAQQLAAVRLHAAPARVERERVQDDVRSHVTTIPSKSQKKKSIGKISK